MPVAARYTHDQAVPIQSPVWRMISDEMRSCGVGAIALFGLTRFQSKHKLEKSSARRWGTDRFDDGAARRGLLGGTEPGPSTGSVDALRPGVVDFTGGVVACQWCATAARSSRSPIAAIQDLIAGKPIIPGIASSPKTPDGGKGDGRHAVVACVGSGPRGRAICPLQRPSMRSSGSASMSRFVGLAGEAGFRSGPLRERPEQRASRIGGDRCMGHDGPVQQAAAPNGLTVSVDGASTI